MQNSNLITGIIGSLFLHASVLFVFLYSPYKPSLSGGQIGDIGDFKSVMIVSDLPVGKIEEISIDQIKAMQNYEASPDIDEAKSDITEPIKDEKISNSISDLEIPSEIEVAKAQKISPKIAKKVQKNKPKKSVKKEKKRRELDKNKPISHISGEFNSIAKGSHSSAPVKGSGKEVSSPSPGSGNGKTASWQGLVNAHLNKRKKYPLFSLANSQEGRVLLSVEMDANGKVIAVKITKKSKFEELNRAAVELLKLSSPLPKPPKSTMGGKKSIILRMPIEYDIKKYKKSLR